MNLIKIDMVISNALANKQIFPSLKSMLVE